MEFTVQILQVNTKSLLKYLQSKDIECIPGSTILYLVVCAGVLNFTPGDLYCCVRQLRASML